MSTENRVALKSYFNTNDEPTELQFANLIDSFWHKSDDTLSVAWANITGVPTTFTPAAHTHAYADLTGKPTLFSGAYADLTGKPALFSGAYSALTGIPSTFSPSPHSHVAGEITGGLFHPSRMGAGVTTDGYMIQLVAGVPTWVVAPSGGGSGISGLTTGKIPKAASGTTLNDSIIDQSGGSYLMVGTTSSFGGGSRGKMMVGYGISVINAGDPDSGAALTSEVSFDQLQSYNARSLVINPAGNNVGIGGGIPAYKLDVNGTARIATVPIITTAAKMLVKDPSTGQISEQLIPSGGGSGSGWNLTPNAGTSPSVNAFGTLDNQAIKFVTNNQQRMWLGTGGDFSVGGANSVSGSGIGIGYGASGMGTSLGQNSNTVANSLAVGENASSAQPYGGAFGQNARSQHLGAVVISTRIQGGSFLNSDVDYQFKVAASEHLFQVGAGLTNAFKILSSGKLAAYAISTYVSEAAGLAAEASGVIFKVGNALYHKP